MRRKYILPILLPVQMLLLQLLAYFPEFVEKYYSNGWYLMLSKVSRTVFGSTKIAVGDLIYFVVIVLILRWFWKKRKTWRHQWKDNLLKVVSFMSVFYFFFHLLWAVNYHRVKLSDKMNISEKYSDAELLQFTKILIIKTNEIHRQIAKSDSSKVIAPYSQEQIFAKNVGGYSNLQKRYPYFRYEKPSIKKSLISTPLSYMGFSGYLNPFTNEAQVNDKMPLYSFPATATHEMAHQIGYASESEANFVGFLAAVYNDDLYIQYSGFTHALRYCLRNWQIRDKKVFDDLIKIVRPGILENFKESTQFWEQYESFVETGFKIFYDNFLKFNQQDEGLESYSRFVDLLVNYYKTEPINIIKL